MPPLTAVEATPFADLTTLRDGLLAALRRPVARLVAIVADVVVVGSTAAWAPRRPPWAPPALAVGLRELDDKSFVLVRQAATVHIVDGVLGLSGVVIHLSEQKDTHAVRD